MLINNQEIRTPFDTPCYAPDWRRQVSAAIISASQPTKLPKEIKKDQFIMAYTKFLKKKASGKTPANLQHIQRVEDWCTNGGEPTKEMIEALLLTDAPLDVIGKDIGGVGTADVDLYCRLFFDVRNEKCEMALSVAQKAHFAGLCQPLTGNRLPSSIWKKAVVVGDYRLLISLWGRDGGNWTECPKLLTSDLALNLSRMILLERLLRGDVSNADLHQMEINDIRRQQLRATTGEADARYKELANDYIKLINLVCQPPKAGGREHEQQTPEGVPNTPAVDTVETVMPDGSVISEPAVNRRIREKLSKYRPSQSSGGGPGNPTGGTA